MLSAGAHFVTAFFNVWLLIMLQRLSGESNGTSMVFIIFIAAVK